MSNGWSLYVIVLTLVCIVGCTWLLFWARTKRVGEPGKGETVGHNFDGIEEFDSPLPRWWLWLFLGSILFGLAYLVLYPGLGSFPGLLGWSSRGQFDEEVQRANAKYGPLYAQFAARPIPDLLKEPQALQIGQRIFANTCVGCHGSDARGGVGFPNLTDNDWLYGGAPEQIETSILRGRGGVMPPFAAAVGGEEGVAQVIAYVLSLSGRQTDPALAAAGKQKFQTICIACHGPEGKGNQALGAPNLTDNIWLYGSTPAAISEGLQKGRAGKMPAHADIIGPEKVHLVAAYVYSLSTTPQ